MRRSLVAGNWKMNGTRASAGSLAADVVARCRGLEGADVVLCPPFVHLDVVAGAVAGSPVGLGAQDVAREAPGAFTGEVAAEMLVDAGCAYVLVGHSERRARYGEADAIVAAKHARALAAGLVPVLCVGETLDDREGKRTETVIGAQIDAVLAEVGAHGMGQGLVAYEPVWAIGTGKVATPEQAQAVHAFVRGRVAAADAAVAADLRILYGGSVKPDNAAALFSCADIDGGLIGGASLDGADFAAICRAAGG